MRPVYFLSGLIVGIVLPACSSDTWSDEAQDRFISECGEEGGKRSYCTCYLEQVMAKYPNPADAEKMDFETAVELASECE